MFSKSDIETYFTGEKQESIWFLTAGMGAVLLSLVFFFILRANVYKGAAIPFFLIGLVLGFVGLTVYNRSDEDRIRNVYAYDMNPSDLREKELPRMEKVMRNFVLLRYAELILLLAGAGLYIYFIRDIRHDFWRGFGLGLALMALLALGSDYFAESRGKKYISGLREFAQRIK